MRVCVVGTGYVGLVAGVCLAHIGHDVICVDNDTSKVSRLQSGQVPIYEPGLADLMRASLAAERLVFTTNLALGVDPSEVLFIAVGTPSLTSGEPDTGAVAAAAREIGACLTTGYKVVVNKSTVPIPSGDWVRQLILEAMPQSGTAQIDVVSNPEFLREGSAIYDTFNPDRIVLGGDSRLATAMMQALYLPIIQRDYAEDRLLPPVPVVLTDLDSAEMIKSAANAFLATKISFINEIANICDRIGMDVTEIARGIGLDSRIGEGGLRAGIGWGGACFSKDVSALVHTAQHYQVKTPLLAATILSNQQQRLWVVTKLQQVLKTLKGKTIGVLGLTFKPNTDDLRDAPALDIIRELKRLGSKVRAYDPMVSPEDINHGLQGIEITHTPEAVAEAADALLLLTDWSDFQPLDYASLALQMTTAIFIDGRNCLEPQRMQKAGFTYLGIGRSLASLSASPADSLGNSLETVEFQDKVTTTNNNCDSFKSQTQQSALI